ncbi:hypothetical protein BC940DRAFT_140717 [Gongronella butleri]|nr:hypothetical protein BC940DRAFT_140717 [Gongronella butleri]
MPPDAFYPTDTRYIYPGHYAHTWHSEDANYLQQPLDPYHHHPCPTLSFTEQEGEIGLEKPAPGVQDINHEPEWQSMTRSLPKSPSITDHSSAYLLERKKDENADSSKVRQITVQSVNREHRVWIDIQPTETGLSLADKIYHIATFRTKKIVKITTAQGRVVPLNARPIFGNWMDMSTFENGEHWDVEWTELDRSTVDKLFSRIVQQLGAKRRHTPRNKIIDNIH